MAEKVEFIVPRRMYLKRVGGGRLKISFSDDIRGSFLVYENFVRDLLDGKRMEVFAAFVEDSSEWREKKKNR